MGEEHPNTDFLPDEDEYYTADFFDRLYPRSPRELQELAGDIPLNELLGADACGGKVIVVGTERLENIDALRSEQITRINCPPNEVPRLDPVPDGSVDRLLFLLSLSEPTLRDTPDKDIERVIQDIERVMTENGKAYIFPIEAGISEGATYDDEGLELALATRSWYNGGTLDSKIIKGNHHETLVMTPAIPTEPHPDDPRISHHAIGDAMMYAYSRDLRGELYDMGPPSKVDVSTDQRLTDIDRFLAHTTRGKCIVNSRKVIEFLIDNYPHHFDRALLLETYVRSENEIDGSDRDKEWAKHACFLVRDKTGRWFAGSPANYNRERLPGQEKNDPLTTYYEGTDLADVLSQLQHAEGGIWADTEFILNGFTYVHPRRKLAFPPYYGRTEKITPTVTTVTTSQAQDGAITSSVSYKKYSDPLATDN